MSIFLFVCVVALPLPSAADEQPRLHETLCPAATEVVSAFYAELNAGRAKDVMRLANKGESAGRALLSCAHNSTAASVVDRDRLEVRAADALFIASVARYRTANIRKEVVDLKAVLRIVDELDPARETSTEHLYQEARLLRRLSGQILGKAPL